MKQHSRINLLTKAINRWLELPRVSRTTIAVSVVQTIKDHGFTSVLANEDIAFRQTEDHYEDARVNAQKLFRWLGYYDDFPIAPDRLYYLEPVILAAMPESIRLAFMNEAYGPIGLAVSARQDSGVQLDFSRMAATLTKENMEAQVAVIDFVANPNITYAEVAHREVSEAAATSNASLEELERHFPQLSPKAVTEQ